MISDVVKIITRSPSVVLYLVAAGVIFGWSIWRYILRLRQEARIKQYGARATQYGGRLPFGTYI